jgi:glycosyltransferase involved in cell wall biosynthesis
MSNEELSKVIVKNDVLNISNITLSIIIPTLNEEEGIIFTLNEINHHLKNIKYEILVIDSDSVDLTVNNALERGAVVYNEKRKGYGIALNTGIQLAKGDVIVILDADGTYPAHNILKFVEILLNNNLDFITANRLNNFHNDSFNNINYIGNLLLSFVMNILFSIRIKDSQSGMWVFRKSIIKKILPNSLDMSFSQEIKIRAFQSCKALELPIYYRKRIGITKLNPFKDGFNNLINLFILRINIKTRY